MYCGGFDGTSSICECFGYKQDVWTALAPISACRHNSASASLVMQSDRKPAFIMAGGWIGSVRLSIVEYFDGSIWQSLSDLPEPVHSHCMVAKNDTVLLSIGGANPIGVTSKTYFFNAEMNQWSPGPDLAAPRYRHSCAFVTWNNPTDGQSEQVVVVVGGHESYDHTTTLSSVELLFINNLAMGWQPGPELPLGIASPVLVEFKESVILVGGGASGVSFRHLYQLSSRDGPWVDMEQALPKARRDQLAFLIPDELTDCQNLS